MSGQAAHVAAPVPRHRRFLILLRNLRHQTFGRQQQPGNRGRILQRRAGHFLRVHYPGLDQVFIFASGDIVAGIALEAFYLLDDLEYDKVELWMDETQSQLKPSEVIKDPEGFCLRYREMTRLAPVACKCSAA